MTQQYFYEKELNRIVDQWQEIHPERVGRFAEQYLEQGFSDEDTWDLRTHLTELILPRLKRYKEVARIKIDFPLDEMIETFEIFEKHNYCSMTMRHSKEDYAKFERGMKAFSEHFMALWW